MEKSLMQEVLFKGTTIKVGEEYLYKCIFDTTATVKSIIEVYIDEYDKYDYFIVYSLNNDYVAEEPMRGEYIQSFIDMITM